MAIVKGIMVLISTRNIDNAGTDGSVYLGLGGREFHVDSSADDFERNSKAAYIFGEVNEDTAPYVRRPVSNPQFNDPRGPFHLYTENLDLTPAYLRWEQGGNNADWSWTTLRRGCSAVSAPPDTSPRRPERAVAR